MLVLLQKIGDPVVAIQKNPNLAFGLESVEVASLRQRVKNLSTLVDFYRYFPGGIGIVLSDIRSQYSVSSVHLISPMCEFDDPSLHAKSFFRRERR